MATGTYYGKGIDGNDYAFKAPDTAYPNALLPDLGLTKVPSGGSLPTSVISQPDNQVAGKFVRIRVSNANRKTFQRFAAANAAAALNSLIGKNIGGAKIERVSFVA